MRTLVTSVVSSGISFGISWVADVVTSTFKTSNNFVEARRGSLCTLDVLRRGQVRLAGLSALPS